MNEFLEYIKLNYKDSPNELQKANEILEILYFEYIKPLHKFLYQSEEKKISNDLIRLIRNLRDNNFDRDKFRSNLIKSNIQKYKIESPLDDVAKETIQNQIINKYRYYVTVIFIAEIIAIENRKDFIKWVIATIIAVLAIVASLDWIFSNSECTSTWFYYY